MTTNASFWNGILADHARANTIADRVTKAVTPAELARDMWTYKGWQISFDMPPIPFRGADWQAVSPDYDCDCDQDGFYRSAGHQVTAATYEELLEEIENCIAENAA